MWNSLGCVLGRGGPVCKEQARPRRVQPPPPPPSQAGRPSRPPAPPPQAPSETNAAHGGLYGARRQRVARLTLRGKFGGGRQGALMRGPPAAAAARGGGGCAPGGNVSRALGRRPRAFPLRSLPLPPPTAGRWREREAPCSPALLLTARVVTPVPAASLLGARLDGSLRKMGSTFLRWAGGLNELTGALELWTKPGIDGFHQPQVEAEIHRRGGTFGFAGCSHHLW